MRRPLNTNSKGFTLIELLIVMAVIAILASIAVPSYFDSIRKARRADAQGVLMQAAQFMERFYSENGCYNVTIGANGVPCDGDGTAVALPASLARSPDTGTQSYTIGIQGGSLNANGYTLEAVPTAGGPMAGDTCGTMTFTSTGVQGATGDAAKCWRRS